MFHVNNKNTRTLLTFSGVFIVKVEHILPFSSASSVDFEEVNVSWEWVFFK